ncbi:MAG: glycosyltransferase family 2 protein [Spirulina sp.]
MMSFSTPIALFIFNRPQLTRIVFEAIAKVKPQQFLIVADGARSEAEWEKCQQARSIVKDIDWPCQISTNFAETNLGCKRRVSSGLDWVFTRVEEAIILEDDCFPAPSFFDFCQVLLHHYRHNPQIMHISGNNFQEGQSRTQNSYYFSKYSHVWGWASWRRAWKYYDVNMREWSEYKKSNNFQQLCDDRWERNYWLNIFDCVQNGAIDTWDYQWLLTCWQHQGLSILPDRNLISNLGFAEENTHDSAAKCWSNLPVEDIWEIHHPNDISRNIIADRYTFDYFFEGEKQRKHNPWLSIVKQKLAMLTRQLNLK